MLQCCDLYENEGGDWVGCVEDQLGIDGNIAADPIFCGDLNPQSPLTLHSASPCAVENSPCGELIGAYGVGCMAAPVQATSWGMLKAQYRTR